MKVNSSPLIAPMCAVLILALCPAARGRLNETVEQLSRRYGEPATPINAENVIVFNYRGFSIRAAIRAGKCAMESFKKKDALTDDEITNFLRANADEGEWVKMKDEPKKRPQWTRLDGDAVAVLVYDHELTIFTKKEYEWFRSIANPAETNGF